ncbi:MAG: ATP synthase F1 subunit gamma [Patescibacteria group bacterium]|jgi:F-type H+-transporting ATPase subunit gamma
MAAEQSREIKARLHSIRNTKKITKAMELVSGAKMRRAVGATLATRSYCTLMWEIMQRLRSNVQLKNTDTTYRFLNPIAPVTDQPIKTCIVVFTSNRGLCSSFNSNVAKLAYRYIKEHAQETVSVIGVGKKGVSLLSTAGIKAKLAYLKDDTAKTPASIIELNKHLYEHFSEKEYDKVLIAYTDYKSAISQAATIKTLFPYATESSINIDAGNITDKNIPVSPVLKAPLERQYKYEPNKTKILDYLIPRIAEVQLYQALLESNASEHSARMLAMKNATDAAADMARTLLLAFNRARQAGITQEIAEISAGSAAVT